MSRLGVLQTARLSVANPTLAKSHASLSRCYTATHSPNSKTSTGSSRRQVTVANDDGRINWSDLSAREKAARTTQQSFNFVVIAVGMVMTGTVGYFMYTDVFSVNSKTSNFNRAVSRIKSSPDCTDLLGESNTIVAYGESPWSSFRRARVDGPTAMTKTEKDATGTEHLRIKFLVKGSRNEGWVNVHMARAQGHDEFEYLLLALDVKGHQRVYLEDASTDSAGRRTSGKLLGIRWW